MGSKEVIIENNADYDQINDIYDGAEGLRKLLKDSRERGAIKEKESKAATKENIKENDNIQGRESTTSEVSKEIIIENKADHDQGADGLRELLKDSKESSPTLVRESRGAPKQGTHKKTEISETDIYEGAEGLRNLLESKDTTAYVPHSNNQESIILHDSTSAVDNDRQPTHVCHSNKDGVTTIEIVDDNVEKQSDNDNPNEKAEEDLSLDNLRNMTGLIKRKLNDKSSGPSQSDKSKYSFSSVTHVKTFQSTKEIRETIQGDISRTRSAIKKKKIIIVHQT